MREAKGFLNFVFSFSERYRFLSRVVVIPLLISDCLCGCVWNEKCDRAQSADLRSVPTVFSHFLANINFEIGFEFVAV